MFAIGWFMKARVAFLLNLETIVGWFFLVPLAVFLSVPIYDATQQETFQYKTTPAARCFR